ncbi:hypothetical protein [Massilia rubra]|uniref:STAS domain-containing protein n=1 Tax=Massilia rubra TaxID=2607910 RepID=A0ABX0LSZ1_9BURK|nr:hypothetical protein [Massilia rubra]NHZ37961.1 hypothetical protein [Massilia rubra]
MQELDVVVDFGGMVLFDCAGLAAFYGGVKEGANLYARLTGSDEVSGWWSRASRCPSSALTTAATA